MPDLRCFHRPAELEPTEIRLPREESHHLVTTNRARVGDTVVVFDGRGNEWVCELATTDKRDAVLKVRFLQKQKPLPYRITLAQALPKGRYMDAIVRKATEIGVAEIAPVLSERTIARIDPGDDDHKLEKWEAAAVEAAKQCGNPWLPEIQPVQKAEDFIASGCREHDLRLIASLQPGAKSLREVLTRYRAEKEREPVRVAWMIGPEGDFTTAEMAHAHNYGFEPVSLGPLVLRCETAAVFALSILSYELQNPPRD
ncbi:16S rRNA (uracil(1498)-N(3))-methyltransferase [Opitutales bacterium ASA1]|uniref:RsmE family RNA methyltransferase n=1 Tax=Congregicoccus parvus TaxID=3081749 RepID=UPI002B2C4FC5|nr:16S rRNA (uracil(1498)-N(3))-methyltransferase [Opitutales bacterium ASA1]